MDSLLKAWAGSIWTLPELLLSPKRHFTAYHISGDQSDASAWLMTTHTVAKNRFAGSYSLSKTDGYRVRRLVDHYLGNLKLSDLELMTVALQCFSERAAGTVGEQYLPGDYSYAMMGLLSRRPHVNPFDSAFLAFARYDSSCSKVGTRRLTMTVRLSLDNYNDRLFERFLCLLPARHDQDWHDLEDAYGAQLWDIEPSVQVAGIGVHKDDETDPIHVEHLEQEFLLASKPEDLEFDPHEFLHSHEGVDGDESDSDSDSDVGFAPPADHSEVRNDDVVILDGCFAAKIHWDAFKTPHHQQRPTVLRILVQSLLAMNFGPLILGAGLLIPFYLSCSNVKTPHSSTSGGVTSYDTKTTNECNQWTGFRIAAVGLLCYSGIIYLIAPIAIRKLLRGKIRETNPGMYGFEGYLPVDEIEKLLFGTSRNRVTWSLHASSPLSIRAFHPQTPASNEESYSEGWVVPQDPCDNPRTKKLVQRAARAGPGDMRVRIEAGTSSFYDSLRLDTDVYLLAPKVFTLVDTYSMTATLFEARRPPEVLLVCGSEGGMQRALACSFDWTTSTFYKETVLRLETRVLSRMDRIRKVRVGIRWTGKSTKPTGRKRKSKFTLMGALSRAFGWSKGRRDGIDNLRSVGMSE